MNIPTSWRYVETPMTKTGTLDSQLFREPNKFVASENMIAYEFLPTEINSLATYSSITINVIDAVAPSETIQIQAFNNNITLIASLTPTTNEFFTPNSGTFNNRVITAEQIANELSNNLAFSQYYNVSSQDFTIIITAKVYGSGYDITFTGTSNIVEISNVSGSDKYKYNQYTDFNNYYTIYVAPLQSEYGVDQDKYLYTPASEYQIPFSSTSLNFNVNEVIKNYVEHVLPTKKLNIGFSVKELDKVTDKLPILRAFFVEWGSVYRYITNGESKKNIQGVTSIRWVQCGAQHKLNYYTLNSYVLDPTQTTPFSFLTSRPDYTPVTYTSHQYIQFIFKRTYPIFATGTLQLKIDVVFMDGTTQSNTLGNYNYELLGGNLSFDVSPSALNLQGIEQIAGKIIQTYSVCVVWTNLTGTFYSNKHYYTLLPACLNEKVNIIWFNDFGAWDSHEFYGTQTKQQTRQTTSYTKNIPFSANTNVGVLSKAASEEVNIINNINHNTNYTISSGLMNIDFYNFMVGITKSTAVYLYDSTEKQYVSINIVDFAVDYNNRNSEFNMKITYNYTVDNNTITR